MTLKQININAEIYKSFKNKSLKAKKDLEIRLNFKSECWWNVKRY